MTLALHWDGELLAQLHVRQNWRVWFGQSATVSPSLAHALRLARSRGLGEVDAITSLDDAIRIERAQIERLLVRLPP